RDIPTDPNDSAIAQAIIAMAHNLGIQVIAEGVETSAQRAFLRTHHCDGMQGYLFSKPLGPEKMTRLLLRNRTVARRRPLPRSPIPLRRRQRD
ncbi:MAG: EAL domain-containing protein, partial [Acidiferrobacterales bacterium]